MKIAILGTGSVGQIFAGRLVALGHEIMIGTRNVQEALKGLKRTSTGIPGFGEWLKSNPGVKLGTFGQAVAFGEMVINATKGANSIQALQIGQIRRSEWQSYHGHCQSTRCR